MFKEGELLSSKCILCESPSLVSYDVQAHKYGWVISTHVEIRITAE